MNLSAYYVRNWEKPLLEHPAAHRTGRARAYRLFSVPGERPDPAAACTVHGPDRAGSCAAALTAAGSFLGCVLAS